MKTITFLTRHYPPSFNINGESVADMVDYIQNNFDISCNVVHVDKSVRDGGGQRKPVGNVIKVSNYLDYKGQFFNGLKMLLDGFMLVWKARKIKNTFFVITTSPPLLPFWASLLIGKNRKRAFWALDLFPEMFNAQGIISSDNLIYKWVVKKTYSVRPEYIIALGPNQANHLSSSCFKDDSIKTLLLPCGFFEEKRPETYPSWYEEDKIIFGYCGNLHDAHNPKFVMDMIDSIDPEKHKLILALYGSKSADVIKYATNKKGVFLTTSVPRPELQFIDVHMVSLLPEYTHLAVPSKAVSAVTMGKTVLFAGSKESDSWDLFKEVGWFINDDANMKTSVQNFCKSITKHEVQKKKQNTAFVFENLKSLVADAYNFVPEYIIEKG